MLACLFVCFVSFLGATLRLLLLLLFFRDNLLANVYISVD